MDPFGPIQRMALLAAFGFAAAHLTLVALTEPRPAFLTTLGLEFIHAGVTAHIVRACIVVATASAIILKMRYRVRNMALGVALIGVPAVSVALHILYQADGLPRGEYWGYFAEPIMFRWLLAPWYAGYSLTLMIACLGFWVAASTASGRQKR